MNLKQLEKEWYAKLKESGFEDIEQPDGNLKSWHSTYFQSRFEPDYFNHKREYFRQAGIFLEWHSFQSKYERDIWRLHSEGKSLREISNSPENTKKLCKDSINSLVKRLAALMQDHEEEKSKPDEQYEFGFNPRRRARR